MNTIDQLIAAAESAADWLCDATPGSDQRERGQVLYNAIQRYKQPPETVDGLTPPPPQEPRCYCGCGHGNDQTPPRIDVTKQVEFGDIDGEHIPLTKCVCGATFKGWSQVVDIYPDSPWECPRCGVKLYFTCDVRVYKLP